MTLEEFENIKEELFKDFWNLEELKIQTQLRASYEEKIDKLIKNAIEVRKNYPLKSTELLLNTFKSNFGVKLLSEMNDLLKSDFTEWTVDKKLRFVKSVYENSYHYFFIITLCNNYEDGYIEKLYNYWFEPNKAKETPKEDNPWLNDKDVVSGKYWILKNSFLFDNFPIDVKVVKDLKDFDSHEKLIITKTRILIINNKLKPTILELTDFNVICEYLISQIKITIHFYLKLLFECNFWLLPIIYLSNSEKFKNNTIPLTLIDQEEKSKMDAKNLLNDSNQKRIVIFFCTLFVYTNEKIWTTIIEEKDLINKFLDNDNLYLDEQMLSKTKNEIKKTNLNMISIAIKKIKEFAFNEDYKIIYDEKQIMDDLFGLLERIINKEYKDFNSILVFGLILVGYLIFNPLGKLKDNLSKMIALKIEET